MPNTQPKEQNTVFRIARTFDASRDQVWKAWTTANPLKQWFGPKGCNVTYCVIEPKAGGASRYCIEFNGNAMWGKWTYKELKAPEQLVAVVTFTDESGDTIVPHPGMPGWPREMLSTVSFNAKGKKTEIVVEWEPHNPTPAERKVFSENQASMQGGWSGTFDQLADYLAKHQ